LSEGKPPTITEKAADWLAIHGSPRTIRGAAVLMVTISAFYGVSWLEGDIEQLLNIILMVPFIASTAVLTAGIFKG
jgi:hypothetical protein